MRFDQIPMGSTVILGSRLVREWDARSPRQILKWYKVDSEKLLAATSLFSAMPYSDQVAGVTNFYPQSRLHHNLQEVDRFFSDEESHILQPFTIHVDVPRPLRRQYGKVFSCNVLAALPALSELIDLDCLDYVPGSVVKEDKPFFPGNNRADPLYYITQLTRTAAGSKSYRYTFGHAQFQNHPARKLAGIRPVISVRGASEFMYDGESYVLVDQQSMLDEDLLSCLL